MKLTAKVKLKPTKAQAELLKRTLETANAACNRMSALAWDAQQFGQFQIHKLSYHCVKAEFDLTAQLLIRCIAKVCDAYKLDKETKRTFKPLGAIPYDSRILSWKMDKDEVSIWVLGGRQKIKFVAGDYHKSRLVHQRGESDLCLIDGNFYLFTTCDIDEPTPKDVEDVLGVDLGVKNIAVDSDGQVHSAKAVNNVRYRHRKLRTKLQKKQTHAARRKLKRLSGKERRFATWVNHNVSKEIVDKAKGTSRGVALEELGGIGDRVTVRKAQRATLSSWSFNQLRLFIEYKAQRQGVKVFPVDPRNTSRTCPDCGCIDKANRPTQSTFSCVHCGFSGLADHIAATNIRSRALVNVPYIPTAPQCRDKANVL
jgi:IS605 OrfB family transposase